MSALDSVSPRVGGVTDSAPRKKRLPPLSLRLSVAERERLTREAAGAPLGPYIRAKALGGPPLRGRRSGVSVEDRQAMAKALALLGSSRLPGNLNQLARLAHIGALPVSPGTGEELRAALADVRAIRRLLMTALGVQREGAVKKRNSEHSASPALRQGWG